MKSFLTRPFSLKIVAVWITFGCLLMPCIGATQDMRKVNIEARQKEAALLQQARQEEAEARKEAEENRRAILADKQKWTAAVSRLKDDNRQLENSNKALEASIQKLILREQAESTDIKKMDAELKELLGLIRINAKDLEAIVRQSPRSALKPDRSDMLQAIIQQTEFPGMKKLQQMTDILFDEMQSSGEVRHAEGTIVDRSGREITADILQLGHFTSAYHLPDETGFLLYSDTSKRFFALSKLPDYPDKRQLEKYMNGKTDSVPIDISKGGALRQLTHRTSLWERIRSGGALVWPILGIGVLAALIILERFVYLSRKNMNADKLMQTIRQAISHQDWKTCGKICSPKHSKPVARVLAAGIQFKSAGREDMENALQEAVLREIPKLERFLSTLGMLAAIAPLLGLLGTVTGMINTFHVITCFGSSDPRMMSGGISEALVTTMLGLSVAIPIMLCHTLLTRMVDKMIGQMEEKAVAFTNLIFKTRAME
jgi:biopolymer transport protein ExbB